MLSKAILNCIEKIFQGNGQNIIIQDIRPFHNTTSGTAYRLQTKLQDYFLKIADQAHTTRLESEYTGLKLLSNTKCVKTPELVGYTTCDDSHEGLLITSWINGSWGGSKAAQRKLGETLAALHDASGEIYHVIQFGLDHDNYIGDNPQYNQWMPTWPEFFIEQRIKPQIAIGIKKRLIDPVFENNLLHLCEIINDLLSSESHTPSLLHGDLWGGNVMFTENDQAVLIDPAVYFGVAEADLAFTELFGGFTRDFYEAYNTVLPIPYHYQERKQFYNLYHELNHMNLFGGMFRGSINALCQRYVG